jgi:hypothetical protein
MPVASGCPRNSAAQVDYFVPEVVPDDMGTEASILSDRTAAPA